MLRGDAPSDSEPAAIMKKRRGHPPWPRNSPKASSPDGLGASGSGTQAGSVTKMKPQSAQQRSEAGKPHGGGGSSASFKAAAALRLTLPTRAGVAAEESAEAAAAAAARMKPKPRSLVLLKTEFTRLFGKQQPELPMEALFCVSVMGVEQRDTEQKGACKGRNQKVDVRTFRFIRRDLCNPFSFFLGFLYSAVYKIPCYPPTFQVRLQSHSAHVIMLVRAEIGTLLLSHKKNGWSLITNEGLLPILQLDLIPKSTAAAVAPAVVAKPQAPTVVATAAAPSALLLPPEMPSQQRMEGSHRFGAAALLAALKRARQSSSMGVAVRQSRQYLRHVELAVPGPVTVGPLRPKASLASKPRAAANPLRLLAWATTDAASSPIEAARGHPPLSKRPRGAGSLRQSSGPHPPPATSEKEEETGQLTAGAATAA